MWSSAGYIIFLRFFTKPELSKKEICNVKNYNFHEFSFERASICDEEQSLANSLAEVEKLQSPISANSRCPVTGAC